jgi:ubiquinone/menaquinone biosynthesis C-methylase UbiE
LAETDSGDADSAVWSCNDSTTSVSLTSSILDYKFENGRRYHAYRAGAYLLPNDELEQDRMDLRHHIFRLTLNGNLFRAPISATPHRCLDVGTGTGIWAMEFADEFPGAVVIGTDLSPIQPQWVPPNCKFLVDDAESDWLYTRDEAFDYIHARSLGGAIADWPRFFRQVYTHLKPGGWVEIQEYETCVKSDDESINRTGKRVTEWQKLVYEAHEKFGKTLNVAEMHKQRIIDAGFVDVRDDIYKVCAPSIV